MADVVVTAAALVAQLPEDEGGGEKYFYRGDSLQGIATEEVQRLIEIGLVEDVSGGAKDTSGTKPKPKQ